MIRIIGQRNSRADDIDVRQRQVVQDPVDQLAVLGIEQHVIGHFAGAFAVITAQNGGEDFGVSASAVSSLNAGAARAGDPRQPGVRREHPR